MKTVSIEAETRPLAGWLLREDTNQVIYLTREGRTRFVLAPVDEGDEEILAMQRNPQLMAYINDCVQRAHKGSTKSLAQIKAELDS